MGLFYNGCDGTTTYDNSHCGTGPFDCGVGCIPDIQYAKKLCFPEYAIRTQCAACTKPVLGLTYVYKSCTNSTDTQMQYCTVPTAEKPCGLDEYWVPCTENADGHCQACNTEVFKAPPERNYITGCGGGYRDYTLHDRTPLDLACPEGMYRQRGDWYTDNICVACDPPCNEGETWEATTCRDKANRYCYPCDKSECPAGMYAFGSCTVNSGPR
jgi:hypothetical protein